MNRPVWSFRSPLSGCELIEPLLPLYSDGFASPAETRLVDVHLPECAGCRASLSWLQATHAALASRPVAVPPPDLHSRIALAIASSSAAPIRLTPARVFSLRPIYAAAASLTALGIALGLSQSLWHTPTQVPGKHNTPPKAIATVPAPAVTKTQALPILKKQTVIAARPPKVVAIKPPQIARQVAPIPETPLEHVANNTPAETQPILKDVVKAPVHRLPSGPPVIANTFKAPSHTITLPSPKPITQKTPDALVVANAFKEPVPVEIKPPTINVDPPSQRIASNAPPASKPDNGLGIVNAYYAAKLRNVSYSASQFAMRDTSRGASNVMHMANGDGATNVVDIHGNQ